MIKNIIIFVIGLIVGVAGCAILFFGYSMPQLGKTLIMLQEGEIAKQGESAYHAYLSEKPGIAVWAYENYIKTLNRLKREMGSSLLLTHEI